MGNAPSSESNEQQQQLQQPQENKNDTTRENSGSEAPINNKKVVSFSAAAVINNQSIDSSSDDSSDDYDDDDDDDEKDQEVASSVPPSPSRSSPSRPSLAENKKTMSYFDLVTGQTITVTPNNISARHRSSMMLWRNSNKSIRMIQAHELTAPAPKWKRTLNKFGFGSTTRLFSSNMNEEEQKEDSQKSSFKLGKGSGHGSSDQDKETKESSSLRHFRIQSRAIQNDHTSLILDSSRSASIVSEYLRWTFQNSFYNVMLVTCGQFLFLSVVFAILIYIVDMNRPQCFPGATRLKNDHVAFGDAYHLSWTTLSTVGYGVISPGTAGLTEDGTRCLGFNILMAIEAFVGVLFGGVTGAIVFGKIARIQSIANVRFSYPVNIRYGLGVMGTGEIENNEKLNESREGNKESEESEGNNPATKVQWPCPILEFRIVNELSGRVGGEIMNATVNVAACRLEKMSVPEEYASLRSRELAKKLAKKKKQNKSHAAKQAKVQRPGATSGTGLLGVRGDAGAMGSIIQKLHHGLSKPLYHLHTHGENSEDEEDKPFNAARVERQVKKHLARKIASAFQKPETVTVDEGNTSLAPRRIYFKLEIETDSHPFFKRVWNIRHELNERSPLLSSVAQRMIARNDGYWPEELNNHKSIRQHVHFHELVVSLGGTANVSGSSVYAQKVYHYVDLNIGYSFAPILAQDDAGRLIVDHRLLDDVREQPGGGGEPLGKINETAAQSQATVQQIELESSEPYEEELGHQDHPETNLNGPEPLSTVSS